MKEDSKADQEEYRAKKVFESELQGWIDAGSQSVKYIEEHNRLKGETNV